MKTIEYAENEEFYNELDEAVKSNSLITVKFNKNKIDKDSKLWPRLSKCSNWNDVKIELEKLQSGESTPIKDILSPPMAGAVVSAGVFWLIAFIATLVAGLIAYGIYKKCKVRFSVKANKDGSADAGLEFSPA